MSRQKLKHPKKSDSPFPVPHSPFPIPFLSQFCYTTDLGLLYRYGKRFSRFHAPRYSIFTYL
ncbi:hypothetical protein CKA32_002563 [Geitlerinema sp. FC II]|nr:hypothetical protein CKA32_002563 [Geitlerinema sp. FC II]